MQVMYTISVSDRSVPLSVTSDYCRAMLKICTWLLIKMPRSLVHSFRLRVTFVRERFSVMKICLVIQRGDVSRLAVVSVQPDHLVEISFQHVQCMRFLAPCGKAQWMELDERNIDAKWKGLDGFGTLCTEHSRLHHVRQERHFGAFNI